VAKTSRLTTTELRAISDALSFALAGEQDEDAFPLGTDPMETAQTKIQAMLGLAPPDHPQPHVVGCGCDGCVCHGCGNPKHTGRCVVLRDRAVMR